ncbi:MAG: efflux RND transporter permease subunit [Planctomycetota bacterium]|jgi:predicted RND superfamily exporter protein|nr:efflux RND transporter permease subunit [Planctomycetota bacterium]
MRAPRRSLLSVIARFAVKRPWLALSLSLGLCTLAALGVFRVQLVTDVSSLLPSGTPVLERFKVLEHTFGGTDTLFIAVESENDSDEQSARRAELVKHIADEVLSWRWDPAGPDPVEHLIERIDGTPSEALEAAKRDVLVANTWLLLKDEELAQITRSLQPNRLVKRMVRPSGSVPPSMHDRDPLGLWTHHYIPWWQEHLNGDSPVLHRNGYLISRDGTMHILLLTPMRQSQDSAFCAELVPRLRQLREDLVADPQWAGLDVINVGGPFVSHRDYETAKGSAWITLVTSLVGVLLLFAIAYRSLRLAVLITVCLLPAIGAALGAAALLLGGQLSMIVSGFAAILIGLGVDFFIHIYNSYGWSLKNHNADSDEHATTAQRREIRGKAALDAVDRVGGGIAAAACTSIATFLVLMLSHYRGLWELGAVCGIGLLIILFQVMLAAPAFLTLAGSMRARPSHALDGFANSLLAHPKIWFGGLVILLLASGIYVATRAEIITFERDPRKLRPANDEVYQEQLAMADRLKLDTSGHQMLFAGPNAAAVITTAHDLLPRLYPLTEDKTGTVTGTETLVIDAAGDMLVPLQGVAIDDLRHRRVAMVGERQLEIAGYAENGIYLRPEAGLSGTEIAPGTSIVFPAVVARLPAMVSWFPTPNRQRQVLATVAALDWDGIDAAIAGLDPDLRARRAPFLKDLAAMRQRAVAGTMLMPDELAVGALAPLVGQVYRRVDDVSYLRMELPLTDRDPLGLERIQPLLGLDATSSGTDGAVSYGTAGAPSIAAAIQQLLETDFSRLAAMALGVTVILVFLGLRSIRGSFQALAAMSAGLVVGLAGMHLFGITWNLMNISVLPLVVGIGIDNGIHYVHALRHCHTGGVRAVRQAINETGQPILMTALTSMVGFGSLGLNAFRGIQSVGTTATLGIAACLIVSLIGLPLLALWLVKRHETKVTLKAVE